MADDAPDISGDALAPVTHLVFISYSAKDQGTADAICRALETQNIKCWIASRDIPGGQRYPRAIVEAITAARVFVLIFSSYSNSSNDVANEVERAFQNEIPIIPFKVENVEPSLDMQYFLSTPQFLNAYTPPLEFHLENLVDTVTALLKLPRVIKRKRHISPAQLRVVVGAAALALALLIGALLIFRPVEPPVNFEKQYKEAVAMLSSAELPNRLEGIRTLDSLSGSGKEEWYWQAMNQLTGFVREQARLPENADQPRKELPPDLLEALKIIAARPPLYPANFTEADKRKKRRDLKKTDLRGLRLVETGHLEYVDLEGANLDHAVLTGANLEGAMLKDAILTDALLGSACLDGVDLGGADINKANLRTTNESCANAATDTKTPKGLDIDNLMLAQNWWCAGLPDEVLKKIQDEYGPIPTEECK